jgi:hypothetical protein
MGGDRAKSSRGREAGHVQAHGKPDGTFQENIQSARGGAIVVAGKWKVSGESAILEGTFNGGPYIINGTKKTLVVKKSGDDTLEGTRLSHYNNRALPISFAKVK